MQDEHIGNFKKLFAEHKLLAAGPLRDPTEFRRGIVVLQVPSAEAVRQCFNADPYVQAGVMHLEVYRWNTHAHGIDIKHVDPNLIAENRILLLSAGDNVGTGKWPRVARKLQGREHGTLEGAGQFREVRLYPGTQAESRLKAALDRDTAVKSGKVSYQLMPLWLAKGTLGEARNAKQ